MRALFWISLLVISYTYVGYAGLLAVLVKLRPKPVHSGPFEPTVSVVIAAHNEEATLPGKLRSLLDTDYDSHRLDVVVASDGSTDRTNLLLRDYDPRVLSVVLARAEGKASALNHAVPQARGEILVFMDARQSVDRDAIRRLVACFADPRVGAVSGELQLETAEGLPSPDGLGLYWRIEKIVRRLESATGSVVGVTGALFAMRRPLWVPLPVGTLLDDVLTPMQVVRSGYRVLFLESAVARDRIFSQHGREFSRKVRTLTGNYQLLQLAPWLLSARNPLLFRFVSHKLLRLIVPFLLLLLLVASALATGVGYRLAFLMQVLLYGMAVVGHFSPTSRRLRSVSVAYTFSMLNVAAAMALYNLLAGRARWA